MSPVLLCIMFFLMLLIPVMMKRMQHCAMDRMLYDIKKAKDADDSPEAVSQAVLGRVADSSVLLAMHVYGDARAKAVYVKLNKLMNKTPEELHAQDA